MRVIYLILISFLLYLPAYAQFGYGKPKDILEVKKRTLIIMLESEDSRKLEKLSKKPEKSASYQEKVDALNQNLKALGEHWEFHDEVLFMEYSEIRELQKKKQHKYAILYIQRILQEEKRGLHFSNRITADLSLALIEKFQKKKPVTTFSLADTYPNKGDLVTAARMLTLHMNNRLEGIKSADYRQEIKRNAHVLRDKTLLLDIELLDKNFEARHIEKLYPYSYQVTDSKTIEEAILRKDPNYAYITIIPLRSGATQELHLVLNAEDSYILGHSAPNIINVSFLNDSGKIHKRHLENYHKLVK